MLLGLSPLRISFAGGGTDIPEYYEHFEGGVVTTSITKFIYIFVSTRTDNSFQLFSANLEKHQTPTKFENLKPQYGTEIATSVLKALDFRDGINILINSDVPAGSGLGASGSLAVNLIHLISKMKKENWSKEKIADIAFRIGRDVLKWPIGKQDEFATTFGGLNYIRFQKNKTIVEPIKLSTSSLHELENNLVLFFVGKTRNSADILSNQISQISNKNQKTLEALHNVKELSEIMHKALLENDLTQFGELLDKGWHEKKKFASGVSNEFVDNCYSKAMSCGALGGKLTGAGGGGHLLLYCDSEKKQNIISEMEKLGLTQIPFDFYDKGPKILNLYDFAKS